MLEHMKAFLQKCGGRLAFAGAGLVIAILFLTAGFFRTLLILICVGAGYLIGLYRDNREQFLTLLERILPKGFK